jgi:hypothetical protein
MIFDSSTLLFLRPKTGGELTGVINEINTFITLKLAIKIKQNTEVLLIENWLFFMEFYPEWRKIIFNCLFEVKK